MIGRRILLLIPHPDDEVVGCAAAIGRGRASGARFFGLYLTSGVPPCEADWPWLRSRHPRRVVRRRHEARAAAAALGVDVVMFADRPARRLKDHLAEAAAEIDDALWRVRADAIWVSAWEGGHQDHDAANYLAARRAGGRPVIEFAEYNFAGGSVRNQTFPAPAGTETLLRLSPEEVATKRRLLAVYASEQVNLAHVGTSIETLRPLPAHDYSLPPHAGTLFRERFHWVPFRHPRVDFEPSAQVRAALR